MEDSSQVRKILLNDLEQAIDVSGAMDNCFFHSLALYYLANDLKFPDSLFKVRENENPSITRLKLRFPDIDIISTFEGQGSSGFLFEKTLVLGVLLRNWFADQLLKDKVNRDALFKTDDENEISFLKLIKDLQHARNFGEEDSAYLALEDNAIYKANEDYFRDLSLEIQPEDEFLFKSYWESQGYLNYCNYLKKAGVKISYNDIKSVLDKLNIPYAIYSKNDASLIAEQITKITNKPKFKIALHAQTGHYFLLQTSTTMDFLKNYAEQLQRYKDERKAVLGNKKRNKLKLCKNNSCWLLALTLPADLLSSNGDSLVLLTQLLDERLYSLPEEVAAKEDAVVDNEILQSPLPQLTQAEQAFVAQLELLNDKIEEFKIKKWENPLYEQAETSATALHETLSSEFNKLVSGQTQYYHFKETCNAAIAEHREVLETHRGSLGEGEKIIGNLLLAIIGLGIGYALAVGINYSVTGRLWFFPTDSAKKLEQLQRGIKALEPQESIIFNSN